MAMKTVIRELGLREREVPLKKPWVVGEKERAQADPVHTA